MGEWQYVAMSIDSSKNSVKLYRNGILVSSGDFGGSNIPITDAPVHYGARGEESYKFKGGLDDFRIYNRALSDDEVLELYNLERPVQVLETIGGLSLWLDATNVDGKQNNSVSGALSQWNDLSGNGNNAIALSGGSSGLISSHSDFNNKPVISFDDTATNNTGFDIPTCSLLVQQN